MDASGEVVEELEKVHVSKMGQGPLAGSIYCCLYEGPGWPDHLFSKKGKETAILILQPPDFFLDLGRVIFIHPATHVGEPFPIR